MPTTNPVPSQDPSDLLFNAGKLDEVVSGSNATYTDRLGVSRRTMAGVDAAADLVLGGLGYAPPVAYAAGIALTLTTQTVEYSGEVYAPKVSVLPFTTSGTFETAKFRLIQGVASADLASGGGAAMVGYTPAGTGAVATTVQEKLREIVSILDFYANGVSGAKVDPTGVVDSSAGIQAAINSLPGGGDVVVPRGTYMCATGLTLPNAKTRLIGEAGAALTYSNPTMTLLTVSGNKCRVEGLTIDSPATFDGTNTYIGYSVVKVTGSNSVVRGCTLNNIPRVGIWVSDANDVQIVENYIDGGTSEGFFTGANTVHFGVTVDTSSAGAQGNIVIANNIIRRCVQGAGSGNTGASSYEQSFTVTGNVFELCWNHGFYSSGFANGHTITGNAFNSCQTAIAATGWNHVISSNTLVVQTTGTGADTDNEITGISLRDPYACIVSNNTIKGEGIDGGVVIGLDDLNAVAGANTVANNIVSNNTIEITNTSVAGVVAIRCYSQSNTVKNNIVSGNIIKAPIRNQDALIALQAAVRAASENNAVENNTIIITGATGGGYGIILSNISDSDVSANRISLEYDSTVFRVISSIAVSTCERIGIRANRIRCSSSYGNNIDFRGIYEVTSGVKNVISNNIFAVNTLKLAATLEFQLVANSGVVVDHAGSGSPEGVIISDVGGIWRRTDGGTATTLYVKESGSSNTGWVAK